MSKKLKNALLTLKYPFWHLQDTIRNYKLKHLRIGKVKQRNKSSSYDDFEIVNISWDVHWMTNLYLAVIIRDYLRFFIKNTPAIGNTVFDEIDITKAMSDEENEFYTKKWESLVNSTADEFDELAKLLRGDVKADEDYQTLEKREKELIKKAFADLAYIFDELFW